MDDQKNLRNKHVEGLFNNFPGDIGKSLLHIRAMIYEEAHANPSVDQLEESLKWGQPSYVSKNKAGTPIRLGVEKKSPGTFGLYVNCSTSLIETVKHIYGDKLTYDGNRGILFHENDTLPEETLRHVINLAMTYHMNTKRI